MECHVDYTKEDGAHCHIDGIEGDEMKEVAIIEACEEENVMKAKENEVAAKICTLKDIYVKAKSSEEDEKCSSRNMTCGRHETVSERG